MKITLLVIGKTDNSEIASLISTYQQRLSHYVSFSMEVIPDVRNTKNITETQQKEAEGDMILKKLSKNDHVILLDENGKQYSSVEFSGFLQKKMNAGFKNLVFIIGGPYGFSETIYKRAQGKVSLSKMTFSHQMVRLFFVEQLYRGFTILRGEKYHHQ